MQSELIKIVIKCGSCSKKVQPETVNFEAESDDRSCPGCDGSGGQMTCLCGGARITKTLEFQCPECNYWGSIYV